MRRENALIGDAVNLAQRMESACSIGCVLMSDAFAQKIDKAFLDSLNPQTKSVKVKGKELDIAVFEISEATIAS